uniref:Uncharacterized protein n=1 Tax=Myotis myotis TaxID=51298 RepID=A0A7J7QSY8_MYOMY|nr:hypothetical protein mMyoMyo1_011848 [Myotis myotis]
MSKFMECNSNELVKHGLHALRVRLPTEQDLPMKNVSIGIVGKDLEFMIDNDNDNVSPFLEDLEERPQRNAQPAQMLMNLQKRLINQWNLHFICILPFYMCKNTGVCMMTIIYTRGGQPFCECKTSKISDSKFFCVPTLIF